MEKPVHSIKIEVHHLLNMLGASPNECQTYLKQFLGDVRAIERIELVYPVTLKVSELKTELKFQKYWKSLFPALFVPIKITTKYKATFVNSIKLKWAGIKFSITSTNEIVLDSYACENLSLILQLLIHLEENRQRQNPEKPALNSTTAYLKDKLGHSYSEGELIDFIDLIYDQYKHTNISVKDFRNVFRCFGVHTEDIANEAFDYYIESKNTVKAWRRSVEEYLKNKVNVEDRVTKQIGALLISEN
ncbi:MULTISPECIES: hypothetical protein [unclassified Saccharicrinis]|uniref:hypothetical protein n=1 Tax=unclassified Saccharicrinis TaxID=2646859 RepID=UPI003D32F1D6